MNPPGPIQRRFSLGTSPVLHSDIELTTEFRTTIHNRSFDMQTQTHVRDQCHVTVTVAGTGMHIYIRPNNTRPGPEHYVTHVTTGSHRTYGS